MNLIEAIKSGRPIRRSGTGWISSQYILDELDRGDLRPFSRASFLADDWEVQEPMMAITASQFWAAANKIIEPKSDCAGLMSDLAKALGLE